MDYITELTAIAKAHGGIIETKIAAQRGISKAMLYKLCKEDKIHRIVKGQYILPDDMQDELLAISNRSERIIFSHETALYLLNLANREPSPFSVTFKTGKNSAGLSKQGIKVYKVKEELFGEGIVEVCSPSGHTVRAYNAERTICDLFRSRRNIEIQDLQEGVKTYIRLKEKNIPLLMRYAKAFSVEKIVRQYLEVLL